MKSVHSFCCVPAFSHSLEASHSGGGVGASLRDGPVCGPCPFLGSFSAALQNPSFTSALSSRAPLQQHSSYVPCRSHWCALSLVYGTSYSLYLSQHGNSSHQHWTQDIASLVAADLVIAVIVLSPDCSCQLCQGSFVFWTRPFEHGWCESSCGHGAKKKKKKFLLLSPVMRG